ncbi:MAG TPA: GntR family transcriptional regulator [Pseudonocardiaceae bacterium]
MADEPVRARGPREDLARRLADTVRELILSGEWPPGRRVPSQNSMHKTYGTSVETIRGAMDILEREGLIVRSQGSPTRVARRLPDRRMFVGAAEVPAEERLAEPPATFVSDRPGGDRRTYEDGGPGVSTEFAELLGIGQDDAVVRRVLLIEDEAGPVLTSTSYVPAELAADAGTWDDVEVGQLALAGHEVSVSAFGEDYLRMPSPAERTVLGMAKGVPLRVISRPAEVRAGGRRLAAGVIVLIPGNRVGLRWPWPRD